MSIQALRERRTALAKELNELLDKNPGDKWVANASNQERYDTAMKEIDAIDGEMKRINDVHERMKSDSMDDKLREHAEKVENDSKGKTTAAMLYNKWLRRGDTALSAEEWAGVRNTLSTTTNSQGGYAVQTDVAKTIMDALKLYGGVRAVATVLQSSMGNTLNIPNSDGTSETGEQIDQNTTATGADFTLGVTSLVTYKYSSKIVAVPFELLQDAEVDIEAFVRQRLATRLGRITNTKFTTGSGSSEPQGVVTAAASGKVGTTGQTATVIFDDIVDLVHSVDPAYRASPSVRFMMADSSLKVLRKLKDSSSRPIFLPGYDGLSGAMADTLFGYQIQINQDVAAMGANAKSILFGDFSRYYIRDVMDIAMFRFTDSAYTKLGQVGFLAWMRSGGVFTDVGKSLMYYQNSAS